MQDSLHMLHTCVKNTLNYRPNRGWVDCEPLSESVAMRGGAKRFELVEREGFTTTTRIDAGLVKDLCQHVGQRGNSFLRIKGGRIPRRSNRREIRTAGIGKRLASAPEFCS